MSTIDLSLLSLLAKLRFDEVKSGEFVHEMDAIVAYVDQLQKVDVSSILVHRNALTPETMRKDCITLSDDETNALLFHNMPHRRGNLLEVPEVFTS